eukprot:179150-Pleurochrysis_carterae.AAC.3
MSPIVPQCISHIRIKVCNECCSGYIEGHGYKALGIGAEPLEKPRNSWRALFTTCSAFLL